MERAEAKAKATGFKARVSNVLDSWFGHDTNPTHPKNEHRLSPRRAPGPGSNAPAPHGPSLYYMMFRHGPEVRTARGAGQGARTYASSSAACALNLLRILCEGLRLADMRESLRWGVVLAGGLSVYARGLRPRSGV